MKRKKAIHELPPVLYKYMTIERFLNSLDDYLDGKVYFANWSKMNDPMEGIPFIDQVNLRATKLEKAFATKLRKCKICSLTTRPDNYAMWSHYAKNHTGVCIGFNVSLDTLRVQEIDYIKITYKNGIPFTQKYTPIIKAINTFEDTPFISNCGHIEKSYLDLMKEILSYKTNDWKYEDEWRLIIKSGTNGLYRIGNIRNIILGYRCESAIDKLENHPCWDKIYPFVDKIVLKTVKNLLVLSIEQQVFCDMKTMEIGDGIELVEYTGNKNNIIVPRLINRKPVIKIKSLAFSGKKLTSASIPSTITEIGDWAFAENELTRVIIPEGVITIGEGAFCNNKLISVEISNTVAKIGENAFQNNCLETLDIPDNVKLIGYGAFEGNTLRRVTIGDNVKFGCADTIDSMDNSWIKSKPDAFVCEGLSGIYINNGKRGGTYTWDSKKYSWRYAAKNEDNE